MILMRTPRRGHADLFYSEDKNEKETGCRANHLARDFGDGEKVGARGASNSKDALRGLWRRLYAADRTASQRRKSVLGLPASENQRLARLRPADFRAGIILARPTNILTLSAQGLGAIARNQTGPDRHTIDACEERAGKQDIGDRQTRGDRKIRA